ncbi:3762_t:CDS:2, partial [Entrophospora sp. SA101]
KTALINEKFAPEILPIEPALDNLYVELNNQVRVKEEDQISQLDISLGKRKNYPTAYVPVNLVT